MKFFHLSLRYRLLLAIIPGFVLLLAFLADVLNDLIFLWIGYAALLGVFVMAPFITSPSRLILRIGVLIAASILIPYAANLSYDWLEIEYDAPFGPIFVILIELLLAAVLVIAAPLKVSRKYWIYVALAALVTTAVYLGSLKLFFCMFDCSWWSPLALFIPASVVAPLSFCTAVYFGRNERIISVMPRRTKLFLVIMVLSILVSVLLWPRSANDNDVYGRAVRLYDDERYVDAIELLESVVRTPKGMWIVFVGNEAERKPMLELLGHMYEYGEGTNVDIDRAFRLYDNALTHGFFEQFPEDPDTGLERYVGYSDSPRAALALCRLIETFKQAVRYCKPFEHPVNAEALGDPDDLKFALDKFRSFLEVSDPNIRLARAAVSGRIDVAIAAIDDGADVNFEYPDESIRESHNRLGITFQHAGERGGHITPLWSAIIRLDLEMTELLLEKGADSNLKPAGVEQSLFSRAWGSVHTSLSKTGEVYFEEVLSRISNILRLLHEHGYDITDEDLVAINQRSGHKDNSAYQQTDDRLDRLARPILSAIEEMQDLNRQ